MSETRWLNEEEQEIWRAYVSSTKLLMAQFDRELQKSVGMQLAHYEILVLLSEAPERAMRMTELSVQTQSLPSRMSHAISRLEQIGWVRRDNCPSDRRGWLAVLTDEGMAALIKAAPTHVESVRRHLFDQLDEAQLTQVGEVSRRLLDHLTPAAESMCQAECASAETE